MNPFSFALGMSNPFTSSLTMGQSAGDIVAPGGNFSPGRTLLGVGALAGAGALAYKYRSPLGAFAKQGLGYIDELLGKGSVPFGPAPGMASAKATGRAKVPFAKYAAAMEEYPVTKATAMGPRTINQGYWRTSPRAGMDGPPIARATSVLDSAVKSDMRKGRTAMSKINSMIYTNLDGAKKGGPLQWGRAISAGRSSVQKLDLRSIVNRGHQVRTASRFQALGRTTKKTQNGKFLARALFRSAVSQQARVKKGKVY